MFVVLGFSGKIMYKFRVEKIYLNDLIKDNYSLISFEPLSFILGVFLLIPVWLIYP